MPIYEYRCSDCKETFETFVRAGRDQVECPSCHGTNLARQMSVFASGSADTSVDRAAIGASLAAGGCCGGHCGCGR